MQNIDFLNTIPNSPTASLLLWIVIGTVSLYLARYPFRRTVQSLCRVLYSGMRLASRSILLAEKKLVRRNKEVLLAAGREAVERAIDREFHRVESTVKRDLSAYPALQLALDKQITLIDEDYRESTEVPPPPPKWVEAVKAVAKLPSQGDTTVATILKDIHKTGIKHYKGIMAEYRKSMSTRHALLKKMMPYWRKLSHTLDDVGKTITGLQERANVIDNKMQEYEEIRSGSDKAERMLSSSAMTQFVISGLVLLIAFGGAVINFNLIALPMSEMVGGGSYIGSFKTSNVAALVIILVEVAMGLYLMESLRITNLFPIIGSMDDKMRRRMILVTFLILLILASVESALAFMRDRIAADMQALRQTLAEVESAGSTNNWIPTLGQMVMGFILPFALTFVAIPLESFVGSSRTVAGVVVAALLRWFAFILRFIGTFAHYTGEFIVNIYDILIFPPLWVEKFVRGKLQKERLSPQEEAS